MQLLNRPPDPETPTVAVDLEGTLTAGATWKGMQNYLAIHENAWQVRRFYYGKIAGALLRRITGGTMRQMKNDWMRDLLRLFKGYPLGRFIEMTEFVVETELWPQRRRVLITELQAHLEAGRRVVVVSGMYETILTTLLNRLPAFEAIGTGLVFDGDAFSGEMSEPFNVGERKVQSLEPFLNAGKLYAAYGDTASDESMLAISTHPTAVHPRKKLQRIAAERNWRILDD